MALEVIADGVGGSLEVLGEGVPGAERRRRWSLEEKLQILAQSVAPGSSVSLTCRAHGLSSGQFYSWRKQFRCGALTGFIGCGYPGRTYASRFASAGRCFSPDDLKRLY